MPAKILSGKPVASEIRESVKLRAKAFDKKNGRKPKLAVVLVGEDPASVVYTNKKEKIALSVGLDHVTVRLPVDSSVENVKKAVLDLNDDPYVDGILLQRPLPPIFKESEVLSWVSPEKDVDGLHPYNVGLLTIGFDGLKPCTPFGVIRLLKHYAISLRGQEVCVIGRSSLVGKPVATLLSHEDATVTICHSKTKDIEKVAKRAKILVVAAGKAGLVTAEFVRPDSVVIDVGIHRKEDGSLCGDVDFDSLVQKVEAITPVPGGVGPMTIAILMENTVLAAERRIK